MRGIFGKQYCDIQVLDRPERALGADEVRLKILTCGVCGTDLHFVRNNSELTPLGHEIAAEVVERGPLAGDYRIGQTVTVEDNAMCGVCAQCKNGRPERCRNLYTMEGQAGMAETLVVNFRALNPYEGLSPLQACMTEPAAVSLTMCRNAGITFADRVVVMGSGAVGLMCVRIAKLMGASTVVLVGGNARSPRGKARQEAGETLGADAVLSADAHADIVEDVQELLHGGADAVILTSPPKTLPDAMAMCAYGGVVSVAGIDLGAKGRVEIDVDAMVLQKLTLKATLTEPSMYFPIASQMIREGKIPTELLVNRTFGFSDAKEAITANAEGTEPIIKAVFMP